MGERDWLTELTSALGDDGAVAAAPTATAEEPPAVDEPVVVPDAAERGLTVVPDPDQPPPAAPSPPVDDELDLMGPGRSLEGWAEELASAFAEPDEPGSFGADADADADADDLGHADGDATEPAAPLGNVLRFDALAAPRAPAAPAMDEAAVTAAVEVAVAVAAADLAAGVAVESVATSERISAAESRLERIESLLTADLSQLGPAVLADSVGDLEVRLAELHTAVAEVTRRVEALPVPDPEALAVHAAVDNAELLGSVGELRAVVDRLTDRVAAQARFLAAHADTQTAEAHQRDDLLKAILARLDSWE